MTQVRQRAIAFVKKNKIKKGSTRDEKLKSSGSAFPGTWGAPGGPRGVASRTAGRGLPALREGPAGRLQEVGAQGTLRSPELHADPGPEAEEGRVPGPRWGTHGWGRRRRQPADGEPGLCSAPAARGRRTGRSLPSPLPPTPALRRDLGCEGRSDRPCSHAGRAWTTYSVTPGGSHAPGQ